LEVRKDWIEKIIRDYVTDNTPGMALLIGEKCRVIFKKGFGLVDLQDRKPITTDTSFIIASITKQFTTMAVMILKQKGLLEYEEPLSRFFPDFPSYISKITIRHLMTHTSGIKEYFDDGFIIKLPASNGYINQQAVLDIIKNFEGLNFEPGTSFSYCNSGYVLLGAIIEMVSGQSFSEFLRGNIFEPLGMKRTVVGVSIGQKIEKMASGYSIVNKNSFVRTPFDSIAIGWADGNIISTVEDLFIWHNSLSTEKLIKKELLNEAFTPYVLNNGTSTNYGFGWFIDNKNGTKQIWHTGGTIGYVSKFYRFIEEDIAIIMLTNMMGIKRDEVFDRIKNVVLDCKN